MNPAIRSVENESETCIIPKCASKAKARGWCDRHWQRWKRHGSPTGGGSDRSRLPVNERFWSKVRKTSECWLWDGPFNDSGYGIFSVGGKSIRAHRFAWTVVIGEIEDGKQLDHRCRNRACIRPDHLREVTAKQNAENLGMRSTNTSGYRNVTFNKLRGKWSVFVGHNGTNYSGGYFDDVHEAGLAAKKLRNDLFTHNDMDRISS